MMNLFLISVSTAVLFFQASAASSYLGVAQGTPLGGFSHHGSFHGGLIPGGLYGNGASILNHGLSVGHLPGPIYTNGGYLDHAYGSGIHSGNAYENSRYQYLYGNRVGLRNPFGGFEGRAVANGITDVEDDRSGSDSESMPGSTNGADFVSSNEDLGSTQTGLTGFPSGLHPYTSNVALGRHPYGSHGSIAGLAGFHYGIGPHTSIAGLRGFPMVLSLWPIGALGFLSNVGPHISQGALGEFPYGLEPYTPINYVTRFPYGSAPHTSIADSIGLHSGLGPYGVSPYLGPYTSAASLSRFNTGLNAPRAALNTLYTDFGSHNSGTISSESRDTQETQVCTDFVSHFTSLVLYTCHEMKTKETMSHFHEHQPRFEKKGLVNSN
ncbi:uncharacterized protein LOC122243460 [Penaeus japonicus]|uniref:uncharacterized protein LOC122243460 n=1 Tax=Penaeus japonicus TaxID=27405 RepID=UPI001C711D44|nr:uncharacterized protein LOC122243460 [Penaeus japonicus]